MIKQYAQVSIMRPKDYGFGERSACRREGCQGVTTTSVCDVVGMETFFLALYGQSLKDIYFFR